MKNIIYFILTFVLTISITYAKDINIVTKSTRVHFIPTIDKTTVKYPLKVINIPKDIFILGYDDCNLVAYFTSNLKTKRIYATSDVMICKSTQKSTIQHYFVKGKLIDKDNKIGLSAQEGTLNGDIISRQTYLTDKKAKEYFQKDPEKKYTGLFLEKDKEFTFVITKITPIDYRNMLDTN